MYTLIYIYIYYSWRPFIPLKTYFISPIAGGLLYFII